MNSFKRKDTKKPGQGRFGRKGKLDNKKRPPRSSSRRQPRFQSPRFQLPKDTQTIDYKDINLLQKFITERGKITSRRLTGVSSKLQRALGQAINRARFLALLPTGGYKRQAGRLSF